MYGQGDFDAQQLEKDGEKAGLVHAPISRSQT